MQINDPRQVYGPVATVWTLPEKYLAKCPGEEADRYSFSNALHTHKLLFLLFGVILVGKNGVLNLFSEYIFYY